MAVDERVDLLGEVKDGFFVELAGLILLFILPEQANKELIPLLLKLVHRSINLHLVVRIENSQQQVHQHEKPND